MSYRFMRLLLFFDLPTSSSEEKKSYRKFIKLIKVNGFYMIQESVYCKMAIDNHMANMTINKIKNNIPNEGNIIVLTVTEKQFASMKILLGESSTDVLSSDDRVVIL